MSGKIAIVILRFAFGALFFYSGITKVRDPIGFLDSVRGFKIFDHIESLTGIQIGPDPWEAWLAMGLPWLEMICGACLLVGFFDRGALTILCGALVVFILAILSAWSRGLDIVCGCFGESTPVSDYRVTVLQRVGLLAVGILLLIAALKEKKPKSVAQEA